ncbi:hypothetical protein HYV89_05640 [Candidatus Woesearchaeota archaeon]|nr:hypothetical protein [Candidatus Woesearchaeota archaeon]
MERKIERERIWTYDFSPQMGNDPYSDKVDVDVEIHYRSFKGSLPANYKIIDDIPSIGIESRGYSRRLYVLAIENEDVLGNIISIIDSTPRPYGKYEHDYAHIWIAPTSRNSRRLLKERVNETLERAGQKK